MELRRCMHEDVHDEIGCSKITLGTNEWPNNKEWLIKLCPIHSIAYYEAI